MTGSLDRGPHKGSPTYLSKAQTAIVVGLGPAGAVTATTLAEAGWHVLGFEKRPAPRADDPVDTRGYAFTLSPRGMDALPDSIRRRIEGQCRELAHRVFVAPDQNRRSYPYGDQESDRLRAVRRSQFQIEALAAAGAAGAELFFDTKVVEVNPAGRVTILKGDDSETREADLIVAADGAFSAVRSRIAAASGTSYAVKFDGVRYVSVPLSAHEVEDLTNATSALHFFSSSAGTDVLIPTPPVSTLLIMSRLIPEAGVLTASAAKELAESRNPEICQHVSSLADRIRDAPVGRFVSTEMAVPYTGKCVVVGDAWNAIPAYSGQGVNAALQDARAVVDALAGSVDLPAALEAYARTRRGTRNAIARLNSSIGRRLMTGRYGSSFGLKDSLLRIVGARSTYQKLVFDGDNSNERH